MINVKPSDFHSTRFIGTPLQNCECELVCGNIVAIALRCGDKFEPFSWEQYCNDCDHNPGWKEQDTLNELIHRGLLAFQDNTYRVTPKFFSTLAEYIFCEDALQRGYGENDKTEVV
jgi:hypothetical protein